MFYVHFLVFLQKRNGSRQFTNFRLMNKNTAWPRALQFTILPMALGQLTNTKKMQFGLKARDITAGFYGISRTVLKMVRLYRQHIHLTKLHCFQIFSMIVTEYYYTKYFGLLTLLFCNITYIYYIIFINVLFFFIHRDHVW